jgi:hypothetical protein
MYAPDLCNLGLVDGFRATLEHRIGPDVRLEDPCSPDLIILYEAFSRI